jgi:hypothetical protein
MSQEMISKGTSVMDMPTTGFPRGDLRVSNAERDRAVAELSGLFTDLPQGVAPAPACAGSVRSARRAPVAAVVIACVMAAIIAGNVLGKAGHSHGHGAGWLVPVLILVLVARRLAQGRQ